MKDDRKLGGLSKQNAALAIISAYTLMRIGMRPGERTLRRAAWGMEHGVTANDFNPKGVKHG